ncbi:MAG: hypothetical protein NC417_03960 [Candidatus Gastranaerophilales bacterium]|nr:hypothetical protein [Candidatus Gastranaerophilales bacterium]
MRKHRKALGCLFICFLMLSGCGRAKGPETIEDTTFSIDADGKVTVYLVGYFGRDYYSLSELTNMVKVEASEYNASRGGEPFVEVSQVELLENDSSKAMILFSYDSADTYSDYNEGSLFYGTVSQAFSDGYALAATPLNNVKDGTLATESYLRQNAAEQHILILDPSAEPQEEQEEHIFVYCPYSVTYLSEGAVLNDDGSVDVAGCEGACYILMKK